MAGPPDPRICTVAGPAAQLCADAPDGRARAIIAAVMEMPKVFIMTALPVARPKTAPMCYRLHVSAVPRHANPRLRSPVRPRPPCPRHPPCRCDPGGAAAREARPHGGRDRDPCAQHLGAHR